MSLPKIEQPIYEIVLPTSGKKIKYRPFTVRERTILLTALQDGSKDSILLAIEELFKVCTFGIASLKSYPIVDSEFLFISIRNKSIGQDLDIVHSCQCGYETELKLDMSNTKVAGTANSTDINMVGGVFLRMKYPTMELAAMLSDDPKEDDVINIIVKCIDLIMVNDVPYKAEDTSFEELKDFVLGLTQPQLTLIESFFGSLPKIVLEAKYVCKECGSTNEILLEGLENFFG
jgi:hypothetical protein